MTTAVKSERITILGTPDFKNFLVREAKKEGVSLSQLVRRRCENKPPNNDDEALLAALVDEIHTATIKARQSLQKGLDDAEKVLAKIQKTT